MTHPYLDYSGFDDVLTGGVKMIPIETEKGTFRVWTKRIGNAPTKKVLLLHGGPGGTHECFEVFDSYFPAAEIEYYTYDQLGSHYSDQPDEPELWTIPRFVEEIEQVRQALHLDADSFYLYGHSWGGTLAIEYALTYQQHLKGLIISNIMASIPAADAFCASTLLPAMDPQALAEIQGLEAAEDYDNPRYGMLVAQHFYAKYMLRMPLGAWPEPLSRMARHINWTIDRQMSGQSPFKHSNELGLWDRTADLPKLTVPTLTIGATHDFCDPAHIEWMAGQVQSGRYLHCPNGSHAALYDDPEPYYEGIIRFINDVDAARF
jgi:proline iminopeptidase